MIDDKKTTYIDFYGKKYPLCLTVSAHERINDTFGGLAGMAQVMSEKDEAAVGAVANLMHALMIGGQSRIKALAWLSGENADVPSVPDLEILKGLLTLEDIPKYQQALFDNVALSSAQEVEVAPETEKNGEATQGLS